MGCIYTAELLSSNAVGYWSSHAQVQGFDSGLTVEIQSLVDAMESGGLPLGKGGKRWSSNWKIGVQCC